MRKNVKRTLAVVMALLMLAALMPGVGGKAYAAADTITRVDVVTDEPFPETFSVGDPVVQPSFSVTSVTSALGTVEISDLDFIPDEYLGWCRSYSAGGSTEWIKYADDGVQDLFFIEGESRMMVDIWVDADAVFTEDTEVYLNGQKMAFYKLYDSDTDYVGYLSYTAEAAPIAISEINIDFDLEAIHYNTAFTEREVSDLINDYAVTVSGTGATNTNRVALGDGLDFWTGTYWRPVYSSTEYISSARSYAVYVDLIDNLEGYFFPESITSYGDRVKIMSGDLPDVTVKVNGMIRSDVELYFLSDTYSYGDCLYAYVPLGAPSTSYVAPELTLTGSTEPMEPGHTRSFTASISGTISSREIVWSVTGGTSSDTVISDGTLTIGEDETAGSVTVTATSAAEPTLAQSLVIPLSYELKPIDSVSVSPEEATGYKGRTLQFTATVTGEQHNKAVNWTVTGGTSSGTSISAEGLLSIGDDEGASVLTVTAASVFDPSKTASATVTVRESLAVSEIDIDFDLEAIHYNIAYTEHEVDDLIAHYAVTVSGTGATNTNRVALGDGLDFWTGTYWRPVYSSTDYISPDKSYAVYVDLIDNLEGYFFPESITSYGDRVKIMSGDLPDVTVKVNGMIRSDVELYFLSETYSYGECLYAYVPLGAPHGTPGWQKIEGDWYFFNADGSMAQNAWKKDSKGWCYLGADGRMVTNGWAKDSKGWCWIGPDGYMVEKTQWIDDGGVWYHITNGYRTVNKWVKDSHGWCYLGADGLMVKNTWKKDSKGWCYLGADGYMVTNDWAKDSKGWCWIGPDGYMVEQTKWIQYDGCWYYIEKGYRVESKWRKDSHGWCYLGADGRMVTSDWVKDSHGWCWIGPDGYMIEETMLIAYGGEIYGIRNGYRVISDSIVIDGVTYSFDANGILIP